MPAHQDGKLFNQNDTGAQGVDARLEVRRRVALKFHQISYKDPQEIDLTG
jgi:hypothetical protein